jgi:lysine/ornithine N-monooxygenase
LSLPGARPDVSRLHLRPSPRDYYDYLQSYARRFDIDVRHNQSVDEVRLADGDGFRVRTEDGTTYGARFVVNASGYFANPQVPDDWGLDATDIPWLHVADYESPDDLANRLEDRSAKLLFVGDCPPANAVVGELCDDQSTHFELDWSADRDNQVDPPERHALWEEWGRYVLEDIQVWLDPRADRDAAVATDVECGPGQSIGGHVTRRADVAGFDEASVRFEDGSERTYDAAVLATGYRPALEHLAPLVSADSPVTWQSFSSRCGTRVVPI